MPRRCSKECLTSTPRPCGFPAPCSCGRTGTEPTRCSWRCCAGPDPRGASYSAARIGATMGIQISPSILASDFARLASEAERVSNADWLHVDVMDNHFVPNLTIGLPVVEALGKASSIPMDCHLMIDDPVRWGPAYVEAGASSVTFHVEASAAPVKLARELRALGARAGMGLRPATPVEPYAEVLGELDMLLLMTVEPGFGGQRFLDLVLPKIRRARELVKDRDLDLWLQVDGGVSVDTIERCADAGADVFVAGSAVYGADDLDAAIGGLRAQAQAATDQSWWAAGR